MDVGCRAAGHRIDPDRIAVWGASAGGHLAALLGTTGGVKEFDAGENLEVSSRVQCVLDWHGPADFEKFADFDGSVPTDTPDSPIAALFGGRVRDRIELARKANPINYITPDDPPFLIMHGDRDKVVPLSQSELLVDALKKSGVPARLYVAKGRGHGSLGEEANNKQIGEFFREQFQPAQ